MTFAELVQAYRSGAIKDPLMIDNDCVSAWAVDADEPAYEAHPNELLTDALDLLGIPHEVV